MRALLPSAFALLAAAAACTVGPTVQELQEHSPPPAFGRPGWVRTSAGIGGWLGGLVGGIVSIVALPVTYPISLLAGDSLGEGSRQDFLLFPATGGAALGHFLFGTPPDLVDYVFRRAWVEPSPMPEFTDVPMSPPPPPKQADVPPAKEPPK